MLNRFRSAVNSVISGVSLASDEQSGESGSNKKQIKHPYSRPDFLKLNADEVQVSADHSSRPILVPRDITRLPWNAGYAEVINAGKSKHNEDQAAAGLFFVKQSTESEGNKSLKYFKEKLKHLDLPFDFDVLDNDPLPFTYFGLFDGHAGTGAALMAVNSLHYILQEHLSAVRDLLLVKRYGLDELELQVDPSAASPLYFLDKSAGVSEESLVVGALERAFFEMDDLIAAEKQGYRIPGGCTALVALFFMGKLYVANAGDCRAILVRGDNTIITMSQDFTPVTERQRVQALGEQHPHLLHDEFTPVEFIRRVSRKDLGNKVLYRDSKMKGWSYKTVSEDDLKFPLIYGDGKRARVLATIGVTRGFGDHDLKVYETDILIKPFLTPMPDVRIYDMAGYEHGADDVLILASDGLWDVLSNTRAADIVAAALRDFDSQELVRYTSAAQELVLAARGLLKKGWRTADDRSGSGDDITAFVIPLHGYRPSPGPVVAAAAAGETPAPSILPVSPSDAVNLLDIGVDAVGGMCAGGGGKECLVNGVVDEAEGEPAVGEEALEAVPASHNEEDKEHTDFAASTVERNQNENLSKGRRLSPEASGSGENSGQADSSATRNMSLPIQGT